MGGYDPYSNSKGCSELITSCYRNTYFNPEKYIEHGTAIASARAGNVIGGGDWAQDRLIPDILRSISKGESIRIRHPDAIRPWQHVLEPLSGYMVLAEKLYTDGIAYAEGWNFGPYENENKTVGWVIKQLVRIWGSGSEWSVDKSQQPHEATYLRLDCSKVRSRLKWYPLWDIGHAIEKIVEWYKAYDQGANMHETTLSQINDFQDSISKAEK
jgi:CDP-glucose 4,6-dehydratase